MPSPRILLRVCVALAIVNAGIVMVIQNSRVLFASARDKAWPAPVNAALSRLLQDVATDDALDADLAAQLGGTWVLRRLALEIVHAPRFNDDVQFATFCSGVGPAWAERRTDLTSPAGAMADDSCLPR